MSETSYHRSQETDRRRTPDHRHQEYHPSRPKVHSETPEEEEEEIRGHPDEERHFRDHRGQSMREKLQAFSKDHMDQHSSREKLVALYPHDALMNPELILQPYRDQTKDLQSGTTTESGHWNPNPLKDQVKQQEQPRRTMEPGKDWKENSNLIPPPPRNFRPHKDQQQVPGIRQISDHLGNWRKKNHGSVINGQEEPQGDPKENPRLIPTFSHREPIHHKNPSRELAQHRSENRRSPGKSPSPVLSTGYQELKEGGDQLNHPDPVDLDHDSYWDEFFTLILSQARKHKKQYLPPDVRQIIERSHDWSSEAGNSNLQGRETRGFKRENKLNKFNDKFNEKCNKYHHFPYKRSLLSNNVIKYNDMHFPVRKKSWSPRKTNLKREPFKEKNLRKIFENNNHDKSTFTEFNGIIPANLKGSFLNYFDKFIHKNNNISKSEIYYNPYIRRKIYDANPYIIVSRNHFLTKDNYKGEDVPLDDFSYTETVYGSRNHFNKNRNFNLNDLNRNFTILNNSNILNNLTNISTKFSQEYKKKGKNDIIFYDYLGLVASENSVAKKNSTNKVNNYNSFSKTFWNLISFDEIKNGEQLNIFKNDSKMPENKNFKTNSRNFKYFQRSPKNFTKEVFDKKKGNLRNSNKNNIKHNIIVMYGNSLENDDIENSWRVKSRNYDTLRINSRKQLGVNKQKSDPSRQFKQLRQLGEGNMEIIEEEIILPESIMSRPNYPNNMSENNLRKAVYNRNLNKSEFSINKNLKVKKYNKNNINKSGKIVNKNFQKKRRLLKGEVYEEHEGDRKRYQVGKPRDTSRSRFFNSQRGRFNQGRIQYRRPYNYFINRPYYHNYHRRVTGVQRLRSHLMGKKLNSVKNYKGLRNGGARNWKLSGDSRNFRKLNELAALRKFPPRESNFSNPTYLNDDYYDSNPPAPLDPSEPHPPSMNPLHPHDHQPPLPPKDPLPRPPPFPPKYPRPFHEPHGYDTPYYPLDPLDTVDYEPQQKPHSPPLHRRYTHHSQQGKLPFLITEIFQVLHN